VQRKAQVLVVGAGIAGLSAARALNRAGVADVYLLELEDQPGGNSRGHVLAGMACPLGAHCLPLPGPQARAVSEWLHEIGLLRYESAARWPTSVTCATARRNACSSKARGSKACCRRPNPGQPSYRNTAVSPAPWRGWGAIGAQHPAPWTAARAARGAARA